MWLNLLRCRSTALTEFSAWLTSLTKASKSLASVDVSFLKVVSLEVSVLFNLSFQFSKVEVVLPRRDASSLVDGCVYDRGETNAVNRKG